MSLPQQSWRLRALIRTGTALLVLVTAGILTAMPAAGQPEPQKFPTPLDFVSHLDLECFKTDPYQPPDVSVYTRHINPLLVDLPAEQVILGPREQLCVPVAKNGILPPPHVLPFIEYVDLSCYRIQGVPVYRPLYLTHLNPQLRDLPGKDIVMTYPEQLCVPVVKNGVYPPPDVLQLISYIDVKCYRAEPQVSLNKSLTLSHLNRVLYDLPRHEARVTYNRQLCVPVQKNDEVIPPEVFNIVQFVDLEKYDIATQPLTTPVQLRLNHINPSLRWLPTEPATIQYANQLMLPVAKDNLIPPG